MTEYFKKGDDIGVNLCTLSFLSNARVKDEYGNLSNAEMLQSRINELENELKGHTVPVAKDKIIAGTMFGPYHYFVLQNNYLMNNTQASLHLADKDNFKYLSRSKLLLEVKLFNGNVKDKKVYFIYSFKKNEIKRHVD